MKTKKSLASNVPAPIQHLFILSATALFMVTFAQQAWFALTQISSNPNLSSFYITFLTLTLMPAVTFVAAYLLVSRKISRKQRIFESLLVAVAGYAVCITLDILVNISLFVLKPTYGIFSSFGIPTVVATLVLSATILYVFRLKKSGRW